LIIAPQKAPGKPKKPIRLRPQRKEGLCIHYQLNLAGSSFSKIAQKLLIQAPTVSNVISGRRRSSRIESEIVRILGKANWNEVVLEARSEVQKKPVSVILQEMEQKTQVRRKEAGERMTSQIAQRRSELGWDQTAAKKPKRRGA